MPIFLNKILNTHPFCSQFAMFYSVFVSYCLIRCFLCERTINAWPTGNKFSREYFYTLCDHIHIVRPFIKVQVWNALEKKGDECLWSHRLIVELLWVDKFHGWHCCCIVRQCIWIALKHISGECVRLSNSVDSLCAQYRIDNWIRCIASQQSLNPSNMSWMHRILHTECWYSCCCCCFLILIFFLVVWQKNEIH